MKLTEEQKKHYAAYFADEWHAEKMDWILAKSIDDMYRAQDQLRKTYRTVRDIIGEEAANAMRDNDPITDEMINMVNGR